MPNTFTEWLIIILVGLLFGKDYILSPILSKWGIKINGEKNGNHKDNGRITDLESHASVANEEMGEVKERLTAIETKLDIMMRHLKI